MNPTIRIFALLLSLFAASFASGADYPAPTEGDFIIRNFKFASGETLPELRLHYRTLGEPKKDEQGKIKKGGKRHPTVEDDVTIYPNSTVLGGETVIGARSTIGGNVFLVQSVPPDSLVYYEETQLRIIPKRKRKAADAGNGFNG